VIKTTSQNLTSGASVTRSQPKSALPKLSELFAAPLIVNGLVISFLLIEKHLLLAFAVAGGLFVGIIIFMSLHYFAEQALGLFTQAKGSSAALPGGQMLVGLVVCGKFIVVGAIMYLLIAVLHLNIALFVVGFLLTQVSVSATVINRLAKTKVTD